MPKFLIIAFATLLLASAASAGERPQCLEFANQTSARAEAIVGSVACRGWVVESSIGSLYGLPLCIAWPLEPGESVHYCLQAGRMDIVAAFAAARGVVDCPARPSAAARLRLAAGGACELVD